MTDPVSLALVALTLEMSPLQRPIRGELFCLAANIYHEARGESKRGQYAVGYVTKRWRTMGPTPRTYCQVVNAKGGFSWVWEKPKNRPKTYNVAAWHASVEAAVKVMTNAVPDPTRGATNYCNPEETRVRWCHANRAVVKIDNHKFVSLPPTRRNKPSSTQVAENDMVVSNTKD